MEVQHQPLQLTITPPQAVPQQAANSAATASNNFWQDSEGPTFQDFLDTINPLQHIPIVSNIYQSFTESTPSAASQIVGSTLFGGVFGLLGSIIDQVVKGETGTDVGGNILSAITGTPTPGAAHIAASEAASAEPEKRYVSASKQAAYNAYVSIQAA